MVKKDRPIAICPTIEGKHQYVITYHKVVHLFILMIEDFIGICDKKFETNTISQLSTSLPKGEITHCIESVPNVSHLWGKMDFL